MPGLYNISLVPGEFSMMIDTDYNALSPNVQNKPNTACNEPEEIEISDTANSVGPIQNNIGEHQISGKTRINSHVKTRDHLEVYFEKREDTRTHILGLTLQLATSLIRWECRVDMKGFLRLWGTSTGRKNLLPLLYKQLNSEEPRVFSYLYHAFTRLK